MIEKFFERLRHQNAGRAEGHKEQARKDEKHQRKDELDRGLGCHFLYLLYALNSQRVRVRTNVLAMLVPNCSDCTSIETRLRTVSTSVRSAMCRQASSRGRPARCSRATMLNSSATAGCAFINSCEVRAVAWSSPRPASTQITSRSSTSGKPSLIFFCREEIFLPSQKSGARYPTPSAAAYMTKGLWWPRPVRATVAMRPTMTSTLLP